MSFEYQRKIDNPRGGPPGDGRSPSAAHSSRCYWARPWATSLHGLPIDSAHNYTGSFWGLLVPFGLYTGLTLTVLSLFLGATYLTLKTDGALHDRCARLSGRLGWLAALIAFGWLTWAHVGLERRFRPQPHRRPGPDRNSRQRPGWPKPDRKAGPSPMAAIAIGSVVGSIFFELFPRLIVSSTNSSLQPDHRQLGQPLLHPHGHDRGRGHLLPAGARYQAWSLWVFRKRLISPPQPGKPAPGPAPEPAPAAVTDLEPGKA